MTGIACLAGVVKIIAAVATSAVGTWSCDPNWVAGHGISGPNDAVYAMTTWDPDGGGPKPEVLVLGGRFSVMAPTPTIVGSGPWNWTTKDTGLSVNHVTYWDGTRWQKLGTGMNGAVQALVVYHGMLVAGGSFTTADGTPAKGIAYWNGGFWIPFGTGISGGSIFRNVDSLTVHKDKLIAGGTFNSIDGVSASNIASWDEENGWQPLGAGINGSVFTITTFGEQLIAGGNFSKAGGVDANCIAAWDGSSWQPLGIGLSPSVCALAVYDGRLVAGGSFTKAGDNDVNHVASWDGSSWQPLGEGVENNVVSFMVHSGQLLAGSGVTITSCSYIPPYNDGPMLPPYYESPGVPIKDKIKKPIAKINSWDGSSWQPIFSAISKSSLSSTIIGGCNTRSAYVGAFAIYNDQLIAAGDFNSVSTVGDGGLSVARATANNIARLDGSMWRAMEIGGMDKPVCAFTVYKDHLIAGGKFTTAGGISNSKGLVQLVEGSWEKLGTLDGDVNSLIVYNAELIAGGSCTIPYSGYGGVARWNGTNWQILGSNGFLYGKVHAFTIYNGQLIVGGKFTRCIRSWNGSTWSDLGQGMTGTTMPAMWLPNVSALTVYNGEIIAGGWFTTAGGITVNNIARWDGSSWKTMGTGVNGHVFSLAVYNGELIAGGAFTAAGGVSSKGIARWNGSTWRPLGTGMEPYNACVYALTDYNGKLIAGGGFTMTDGVSCSIASWNGNALQKMPGVGSQTSGTVYALGVYDGQLVAGGNFTTAAGKSSLYFARWSEPVHYDGDLDHDCNVDLNDLSILLGRWLDDGCLYDGWCNGADQNYDTKVDLKDFGKITGSWNYGVSPRRRH